MSKKLKEIVAVLIVIIQWNISMAQSPVFEWAKAYSGVANADGKGVGVDSIGNVFTTGTFKGTVDFDPGPSVFNLSSAGSQSDIFISKLDSLGNFLWAVSIGNTNDDIANEIDVDYAGNVFVTGTFSGTVDFDPGPATYNLISSASTAAFILKLDPAGNFLWAKKLDGNGICIGQSIISDYSGSIYTTGWFNDTIDFDPGPSAYNLIPNGSSDIYVSKLSAAGNFVWAKKIGGTGNDVGRFITSDQSGVYFTGHFSGTVDFDPNAGSSNLTSSLTYDIFICKLDFSGNYVWAKNIGGNSGTSPSSPEDGFCIAVDAVSNVYVCGNFGGSGDFDPGAGVYTLDAASPGSQIDGFVCKLNAAGNFVWARQLHGNGNENLNSIALDGTRNVYLSGSYSKPVDFDPGSSSYILSPVDTSFYDFFIAKLSHSGNFIWARSIGSDSSNDFSNSVVVDNKNNIYITGSFQDTVDFDPDASIFSIPSAGSSDGFTEKFSQSPFASVNENNINEVVSLYPNPTSNVVNIIFPTNTPNGVENKATISIFNIIGQVLYLKETKSERIEIDMRNFQNGVYIIQVQIKNGNTITKRLIKN